MNRFLLIIWLFAFPVFSVCGQEGIFYYGTNLKPVDNKKEAVLIKAVKRRSTDTYIMKTRRLVNGEWKHVSREKIKIQPDGDQVIRYRADNFFPKKMVREMEKLGSNGYIFRESTQNRLVRTGISSAFLPLHLENTVKEYHPNGEIKSIATYRNNQLVSNENWLPDGSPYIDSIFYSVDREPEYRMGDDFFTNFLLQQLESSKIDLTQIEDQVVIGWVVMETGTIKGVTVLKGKVRQLNDILVETIRQLPGSWEPALLNGSPVRYFMSIPLNFSQRQARFQELEISSGMLHYEKY